MRYAVDTNVAKIASYMVERDRSRGAQAPHPDCQLRAVNFLIELVTSGVTLIDDADEITGEYRRNKLSQSGQPGVGDLFYRHVLEYHPDRVEKVRLRHGRRQRYLDLPQPLRRSGFDQNDRKFAAVALVGRGLVANATDGGWIKFASLLERSCVQVNNLCGCDSASWFK